MEFYAIFFWLLIGFVLGFGSMFAYFIWWWKKAAERGLVALKDNDGKWIYKKGSPGDVQAG